MVRRLADAVVEVRGPRGFLHPPTSTSRAQQDGRRSAAGTPTHTPTPAQSPTSRSRPVRRYMCYLVGLLLLCALTPILLLTGLDVDCPTSPAVFSWDGTNNMQALRRECAAGELLAADGMTAVWKRKHSIYYDVFAPYNASSRAAGDLQWGLPPDAPLLVFSTQMSMDRLPRLTRLVAAWGGPVSVAVSLCTGSELSVLRAAFESSPPLSSSVFLHVVVGHDAYFPINFLRNVAAEGAARVSDWAVVSDVDMMPSQPMQAMSVDVAAAAAAVKSAGAQLTRSVLVLPALEATSDDVPIDSIINTPKASLRVQWDHSRIQTMHPYHPPSYHGPFDISVWMRRDQAYEVQYEQHFEGYYVAHQPIIPFDERFVGRRRNKMSQWFEMWAAGYRFWVLPHSWVVDVPHTMGIRQAQVERMYRLKWHAFVSEIVAKYDVQCTAPDNHCWWRDEGLETFPLGSYRDHAVLWTQALLCQ